MTTKPTFAERKEEAKATVEKMHAKLASFVNDDAQWKEYLAFMSRFHNYSPGNIMLMWFQWEMRKIERLAEIEAEIALHGTTELQPLPDFTQPAAFSTWKDMGGAVRKGEKGLSVLAPVIIKDKDDLDKDGKPKERLIGFVLKSRTFEISQVDGVTLPEQSKLLEGEAPEGVWDKLVALATHLNYRVEMVRPGQANGRVSFFNDLIEVRPDVSTAQQVKTLIHELAHALLHDPRLDTTFRDGAIKECEAESVAYVVGQAFDFDTSDYSFGYVSHWSQDDPSVVATTVERVVLTAARVTTWIAEGKLPVAKGAAKGKAPEEDDEATEAA